MSARKIFRSENELFGSSFFFSSRAEIATKGEEQHALLYQLREEVRSLTYL